MKSQNKNHNSLANYFEQRGFYIILTLCVISIGVAGYVYLSSDEENSSLSPGITLENVVMPKSNSEISNAPVLYDSPVEVEDNDPIDISSYYEEDAVSENSTDEQVVQTPSIEPESSQVSIPNDDTTVDAVETNTAEVNTVSDKVVVDQPEFVRPVSGSIVHGFSGEDVEYSETLEDWRVHSGTDFKATYGEQVKVITDGTIEDIYYDEIHGQCILVDHGDGIKTLYTGLMEAVAVKVGEKVSSGTVIGGFGDTAIYEAEEEARLHVELIKDGVRANLETILPSN